LIQGLASTDVGLFDSIILKGIQVQALWFIMSVMLVKAMSGVEDAAVISSQGAISKISFSFLRSARKKFQHLMDEGKSVQNFEFDSKKVREWSRFPKGGKTSEFMTRRRLLMTNQSRILAPLVGDHRRI